MWHRSLALREWVKSISSIFGGFHLLLVDTKSDYRVPCCWSQPSRSKDSSEAGVNKCQNLLHYNCGSPCFSSTGQSRFYSIVEDPDLDVAGQVNDTQMFLIWRTFLCPADLQFYITVCLHWFVCLTSLIKDRLPPLFFTSVCGFPNFPDSFLMLVDHSHSFPWWAVTSVSLTSMFIYFIFPAFMLFLAILQVSEYSLWVQAFSACTWLLINTICWLLMSFLFSPPSSWESHFLWCCFLGLSTCWCEWLIDCYFLSMVSFSSRFTRI